MTILVKYEDRLCSAELAVGMVPGHVVTTITQSTVENHTVALKNSCSNSYLVFLRCEHACACILKYLFDQFQFLDDFFGSLVKTLVMHEHLPLADNCMSVLC